jgi:TonB family protein
MAAIVQSLRLQLTLLILLWPLESPLAQTTQNIGSNTPGSENAASLPSDPAMLLSLAARANGLEGSDLQPWHIKVSYQMFDTDGDPQNSGTFEEFWASLNKYKRTYTSENFTQTDFATDAGLFRSGNQEWPGAAEIKVRALLLQPLAEADLQNSSLEKSEHSFGQATLDCVTVKPPPTNKTQYRMFWFEAKLRKRLRIAHHAHPDDSQGAGHNETLYNNIVTFQGRYLARDVKVTDNGKVRLSIHVETIETLPNLDNLNAPPDAIGPITGRIKLPSVTMLALGLVRHRTAPVYPASAKQAHIQGTVVVQAVIGKDGKVSELHAVSGPAQLQQSAIDCVRKWEFRPFVVSGKPAEVESKFELLFVRAG